MQVLPQWVKLGVNPNQTQLTPEQPVLGVESGVGQNKQLNYGVPTPNLGEVLSPKGNYDTYTKFFKGIGIKNYLMVQCIQLIWIQPVKIFA